jgi:hypothetical protein
MDAAQKQEFYSQLKGLATAELIPAMREAIKGRPAEDKKEIAQTAATAANGVLQPPDGETRNKLWLIIVIAFAIVLVGGFITLALGVFLLEGEKVRPELVLTMFTTVVGFLAGLFTPSPVAKASERNAGE